MMSIGKRIPLVASITSHTRLENNLSLNEHLVWLSMRQNPLRGNRTFGASDGLRYVLVLQRLFHDNHADFHQKYDYPMRQ